MSTIFRMLEILGLILHVMAFRF